jgi:hypothetical protein
MTKMADLFEADFRGEHVDWVAVFAAMSDEEFLKYNGTIIDIRQQAIYNAEWEKRHKRDQERNAANKARREQAAQERAAIIQKQKDALQYSDKLATEICERVSAGELLTVICLDEHLPSVRRFTLWCKQRPEHVALYNEALQDRLVIFEEDVIRIADEAARDFDVVSDKKGTRRTLDPARVTASKQRIEVRFRHLKDREAAKMG